MHMLPNCPVPDGCYTVNSSYSPKRYSPYLVFFMVSALAWSSSRTRGSLPVRSRRAATTHSTASRPHSLRSRHQTTSPRLMTMNSPSDGVPKSAGGGVRIVAADLRRARSNALRTPGAFGHLRTSTSCASCGEAVEASPRSRGSWEGAKPASRYARCG